MDENEFNKIVESLLLNDSYRDSKSVHKKYQFMQFLDGEGNILQGVKVRLEDANGNMMGTEGFDVLTQRPVVYNFVDGLLDSSEDNHAIEYPNHYEVWRKGLLEKVWADGGDTIEFWENGIPVRIETNVIERRKNGEII